MAPVNLEIATVAVWILGSLIMDSAMMNSFQLWMKVRIAVGEDARRGEREQDPAERLPLGAAVDHGGFLEVDGRAFMNVVRFQTASGIARTGWGRSWPGRC